MGKYSGILLCSDFDGTLYNDNKLSRENIEAIRYFQENGGHFTIATGRFPSFIKTFEESIKLNTYIIGLNGSIMYDLEKDELISEGFLPAPFEKYALKICREVQGLKHILLFRKENQSTLEIKCENMERFRSCVDESPLYKIVLRVDKDCSDRALTHIESIVGENFSVTRSYITGIEINGASHTKGKAVRRLAAILNAEKLVCVGDYENDISMITAADIGYAVGNATDSLKLCADKITVPVQESAIAKIISEL